MQATAAGGSKDSTGAMVVRAGAARVVRMTPMTDEAATEVRAERVAMGVMVATAVMAVMVGISLFSMTRMPSFPTLLQTLTMVCPPGRRARGEPKASMVGVGPVVTGVPAIQGAAAVSKVTMV
jgi:hypothetical protein